MSIERTLSIVKPDAVAKNVIGEIYSRFEKAGLKIVAAKMTISSDLTEDGLAQAQITDDGAGAEVEVFNNQRSDLLVGDLAGAEGFHIDDGFLDALFNKLVVVKAGVLLFIRPQ